MITDRPHHRVRLTECPICGKDLSETIPAGHIAREHEPRDLALTPLGEGDQ
jgi:hypothetical protein